MLLILLSSGDWLCAFIASPKFLYQSKFLDYCNRNVDGIGKSKICKNNVQYMVGFLQTLVSVSSGLVNCKGLR